MIVNEIIDVKYLVQYLVCGNCPPPQEKNNKQNIKPQSSLEKIWLIIVSLCPWAKFSCVKYMESGVTVLVPLEVIQFI